MRIALVSTEYPSPRDPCGGLANYVHRLSRTLVALGHEVIVLVPADLDERTDEDGVQVRRVSTAWNYSIKCLDYLTLKLFSYSLQIAWMSRRLAKVLNDCCTEAPVDLVQYTQLDAVGLFRLSNLPSVVRLSSYTPLWRAHGDYDYYGLWVMVQREWLERMAMMRMDALFCPSYYLAEYVAKRIGRPVSVVEPTYEWQQGVLDSSVYQRYLEGKDYLLFFGRLHPVKGLLTIACCLAELLGRHPELFFAFAGNQYLNVGRAIFEKVKESAGPFADRVIYLGSLRQELLVPVIDGAFAVVLPSLVDNLPNTCIESMGRGKVVIGTRGASFEQLIDDGESGFLCEAGNSAGLLDTMERVLRTDSRDLRRIGDAARRRVQTMTPEKSVGELMAFYRSIIERRLAG